MAVEKQVLLGRLVGLGPGSAVFPDPHCPLSVMGAVVDDAVGGRGLHPCSLGGSWEHVSGPLTAPPHTEILLP